LLGHGQSNVEVYSVVQASDESNAFAGCTNSSGASGFDVWLVKTKPTVVEYPGLPQPQVTSDIVAWAKSYGGLLDDKASKLVIWNENGTWGYLIAGYSKSYGAGGSDMYLLKVDSNSNLLWNKTYGGALDDAATTLAIDCNGGYVLAGYTNSNVTAQCTWVVKVDSSGKTQWNTTYAGQSATSIIQTSDGGYALTMDYPNAYGLVKLDAKGKLQWKQTYPGHESDAESKALVQTSSGGYAVAGWIQNSTGGYSTWLLWTDAAGVVQWNRTYAGWGAYAIIKTSSGTYAMTGDNARLVIVDSSGNILYDEDHSGVTLPIFTRAYDIIENNNEYDLAIVQESYGQNDRGLQSYLKTITIHL
jgi:hypothetical protein